MTGMGGRIGSWVEQQERRSHEMFYKMIMAMVLSALVCGITATQAVEVTAFEDDFNTAPLSAAKWTNATNG